MESETIILGYLESVLGRSKKTARNNHAFICPNGCVSPKHKLEVSISDNKFNCWVCSGEKGGYKGKNLVNLFKQVKAPQHVIDEVKSLLNNNTNSSIEWNDNKFVEQKQIIQLPDEYKPLYPQPTEIIARHALAYLKKRRIIQEDIIKYNIGYCATGKYKNRIIIPLYNGKGELIYFEARSFDDNSLHYLKPDFPRDIIPNEYLINWNLPIILCEGAFDMIAIKRNVIPLLGKSIQDELMKKLVTSQVKKIYIALDADALKKALQYCEILLQAEKEVYLVKMEKDASLLGFLAFTESIQTIQPLTYSKLLEYKLSKI